MSGVKDPALSEFQRSLRPIGGVSGLAILARVGRSHLSQVLSGDRSGATTWKHVLPILGPSQIDLLKRCQVWREFAEVEWLKISGDREKVGRRELDYVSAGTLCYVER